MDESPQPHYVVPHEYSPRIRRISLRYLAFLGVMLGIALWINSLFLDTSIELIESGLTFSQYLRSDLLLLHLIYVPSVYLTPIIAITLVRMLRAWQYPTHHREFAIGSYVLYSVWDQMTR